MLRSLARGARRVALAGALAALPIVGIALASSASDGVLEINQTCAIQTGCFPNDTPGYPVTITRAGSYRLTSNLATSSRALTAISITSDDVTVDLGGFTIACTFNTGAVPVGCLFGGSGDGVASGTSNARITVRSGGVRDMGREGIRVGPEGRVEAVHVADNGDDGIFAGVRSTVSGSTVRNNAADGILANNGAIVTGNTVSGNGDDGIQTGSVSTISGNGSFNNGNDGIHSASGSTVSGNTVSNNSNIGIFASTGSTVSDNTADFNGTDGISASTGSTVSGNTAFSNGDDGISVPDGCLVQRNTMSGNTTYGLRTSLSAYRANVITNNGVGAVSNFFSGIGVNRGDNYCQGTGVFSSTCP